jgi:outer membrane biosynthesis protein TonB
MRQGIVFSALMHITLAVLIIVGLPFVRRPLPPLAPPVVVEILPITENSNPRQGRKHVEKVKEPKAAEAETRRSASQKKAEEPPKVKPKPKPVVEKPKPKPKVAEKPKPLPKPKVAEIPKPKPKPKVVEKPKPKPKPEPKVAALPKPKPEPKPEPPRKADTPAPEPRVKAKPRPKPAAKPKPKKRMTLAGILNSVDQLKRDAKEAPRERAAPNERRGSPRHDPSLSLSRSEFDALRRQLSSCWNFPAGAKDSVSLIVEIKVVVNRDRTVREARIVDVARMRRDPYFRSAAESALRAVQNPRCSPLQLPPNKYRLWRSMTLEFDPREMLGG